MATYQDYIEQSARLEAEKEREDEALQIAHVRHGGDHRAPYEPPVPTIITQFGTWAVTEYGIECLTHAHQIQWDAVLDERTDDDYWLRNMSRHDWVNLLDFVEALRHGRRIHSYLQQIQQ